MSNEEEGDPGGDVKELKDVYGHFAAVWLRSRHESYIIMILKIGVSGGR